MRALAAIFCLLALEACGGATFATQAGPPASVGAPSPAPPNLRAESFVGMSKAGLQGCAGLPYERNTSVREGPTEFWFYQTAGEPYCKAQFTIRQERVAAARFADRAENVLTDLSSCMPIIQACAG